MTQKLFCLDQSPNKGRDTWSFRMNDSIGDVYCSPFVLLSCIFLNCAYVFFQEWCHWEYATIRSTERWILWSPRTLGSLRVSSNARCYYTFNVLLFLTCRYVDEGRNPELFTRHQLERTLSDHIGIQKKVQAYKVNSLVMPCCACASEVYISVSV